MNKKKPASNGRGVQQQQHHQHQQQAHYTTFFISHTWISNSSQPDKEHAPCRLSLVCRGRNRRKIVRSACHPNGAYDLEYGPKTSGRRVREWLPFLPSFFVCYSAARTFFVRRLVAEGTSARGAWMCVFSEFVCLFFRFVESIRRTRRVAKPNKANLFHVKNKMQFTSIGLQTAASFFQFELIERPKWIGCLLFGVCTSTMT